MRTAASNKSKVVIGLGDEPESVTLLGQVVGKAGYTFFGTTSGPECLSLLSRIEPRLILLDVQMPGMDGFETCRHIRKDARLARVPIAFLTALKRPADVQAGMAAGGNDFILKPFNPVVLLNRVNHWTSQRLTNI
jgi:CheY-like chemotaxis protein